MPIYSFNGIEWGQLSKYIEIPINNITNFGGIEVPAGGNLQVGSYFLSTAQMPSIPSASISASAPTNIQSGDLLLLYCHADNIITTQLFSLPSGWTSSFSDYSDVYDIETTLFYKISNGSEGNVNIGLDSIAASFADIAVWYIRIPGADQTNPITLGSLSQNTSTFITASSLNTPVDNCLVFAGVTFDGGDGEPFTPNGSDWPSTIPPGQQAEVGTTGANLSCGWITKNIPLSGPSLDVIFTAQVNDGIQARQFAIRPAP